MKRSEMVRIIKNNAPDLYMTEEECDILLSVIERHGMLPPSTTFYIGNTEYNDNVWEKE